MSNLHVLDNIVLVQDVHRSFTKNSAVDTAMERLARLGLEEKAYMHHTKLGYRSTFLVQLVRASMMESGTIMIDRPFGMVPTAKGLEFFTDAFEKLGLDHADIVIMDLQSQEYKYTELLCNIKKCL